MYAVVDCDNCYVSCERVFHPELDGMPVVVLSNNDGCVVARSNEAKRLGIKAGTPYFQLAQQFPDAKIAVFSSNYELYGELTGRVMKIIQESAPAYFRYSIDEAFCMLHGMKDLKLWGENLHQRIKKSVGIPVSIGIASTKTLAKMASHFAKKYAGYNHCCLIQTEEQRAKALQLYDVSEVWGIGRRYAVRLESMGVKTAYDFASKPEEWVRRQGNINLQRTWRELHGQDCVPNEEAAKKKSICTSRSFNGMVTDLETLRAHVANYATRCAEKLRIDGSAATAVGVFLRTNFFRDDLPQIESCIDLPFATPTDSSISIVEKAEECLERIYQPGYHYKKAGVILMCADASRGLQPDLFEYDADKYEKLKRLDAAIDKLNRVGGKGTVVIAAQRHAKHDLSVTKHDMKSKNPTTRWSDIILLK